MIDNEIPLFSLSHYSNWIPFKYFYIEENLKKLYLRCHFPLIKEIWIDLIMKKTINLFHGDLKYDSNVIGSLLELNLVQKIKRKELGLDVDNFVEINSIYNMEQIIEAENEIFKNKNILITQHESKW